MKTFELCCTQQQLELLVTQALHWVSCPEIIKIQRLLMLFAYVCCWSINSTWSSVALCIENENDALHQNMRFTANTLSLVYSSDSDHQPWRRVAVHLLWNASIPEMPDSVMMTVPLSSGSLWLQSKCDKLWYNLYCWTFSNCTLIASTG